MPLSKPLARPCQMRGEPKSAANVGLQHGQKETPAILPSPKGGVNTFYQSITTISKQQSRQLLGFRRLFTELNAELNRLL